MRDVGSESGPRSEPGTGVETELGQVPGRSDEQRTLEPGTRVDHFEIRRLIGRGGMGEVYLARDTNLGRKVAL